MRQFEYKKELLLWILVLIPCIYVAYYLRVLPAQVAVHFDLDGTANGWGSKFILLIVPAISIVMYGVLAYMPQLNPKKLSPTFYTDKVYVFRIAIGVMLAVLTVITTQASLQGQLMYAKWMPAFIFAIISIFGKLMIDLEPNWFIGIRTPWTLSSETVWRETHRVGGQLWYYGGAVCVVLSLILPLKWTGVLLLGFPLLSGAYIVYYSYMLYQQEQRT